MPLLSARAPTRPSWFLLAEAAEEFYSRLRARRIPPAFLRGFLTAGERFLYKCFVRMNLSENVSARYYPRDIREMVCHRPSATSAFAKHGLLRLCLRCSRANVKHVQIHAKLNRRSLCIGCIGHRFAPSFIVRRCRNYSRHCCTMCHLFLMRGRILMR
jgi:hypothetical protein